jgi:hypothetical protein
MESARPFSERMQWAVTTSCGCSYDVLIIDNREVAFIVPCPAGWAMRMNHLPHGAPGAQAITPTLDEAKRAAEDYFLGLDIVPWD